MSNRDRIVERSFSFSGIGESTGSDDEYLDPSVPVNLDVGINLFTPANADDAAGASGRGAGLADFYFVQIGSFIDDPSDALGGINAAGFAADNFARQSDGTVNFNNFTGNVFESVPVASIFTDVINGLTPSNPNENILTSGDLEATVNAIAGTISHEIGHTLSLNPHVYTDNAETDGNIPLLMSSSSTGLTVDDRIEDRAFSFQAFDQPAGAGNELNNIEQLVDVVGTRNSASVPFEFSPAMGLLLVGGTWGFASWRKKSQLKDLS